MTDTPTPPEYDDDAELRALWARLGRPRHAVGMDGVEIARLAAWVDGTLSEAEAEAIEARLAADPRLLDLALSLRAAMPSPAAIGREMRLRFVAAIPTEAPGARPGVAAWRPAPWLSRVAAVLLVVAASTVASVGSYVMGGMASDAAIMSSTDDPLGLGRLLEPAGIVREDDA